MRPNFYKQALYLIYLALISCFPATVAATTYSVAATAYSWIDASTHTKLGPTTGGVYSSLYSFGDTGGCGTAPPDIDDTLSSNIPLGFTFNYGTMPFTAVRIMTNGRIQFNNNTTCGYGSPVTQIPYPDASLTYSMRIYGNDLDPSMQSEISGYTTPCTSRSTCYISYASLGTAPNRIFVVTYNNIPEWAATNAATGNYNLQIILKENGQFIFQYGADTPGPQATVAQIGWEISTTDYAVAGIGYPSNNSAFLFFIPSTGIVTPGAFNAFDTSTWLGSTTGMIQTKIAGSAFTLDVVALTTTPTVLTNFNGSVKVELVDASSTASCSAMTSIQTVVSSYNFTGSDAGRHTFSGITQAEAYPKVGVRISYPATSPTQVVCSTDQFAIRPNSFSVQASDATWSSAGTARTLNAATASATPTHKAGQPFSLTVTPYNALGAVTSSYNGAPAAAVTCALPATGCVTGVFSVGAFSLSGGIATSTTASYTEAGAVSLTISDSTYAQVDAADGTSSSQLTIASAPLTVGRFIPDHFDVTLNAPQFKPGCGTFTYMGQPLTYAVNPVASITAKNAAAAATQNYTGSLFKVVASGVTPSYSETSHALTVLNALSPAASDNGSGNGALTFADTVSNILGVTRSASPVSPFSVNLAMSFTLQDSDGVTVGNVNGVAAVNPVQFGAVTAGNGIAFTGGYNSQSWGRLALSNVNGSELTALVAPLTAQYYNGVAFVTNSSDNCTALNLAGQFSLNNPATAGGANQAGTASMTVGAGGSSATLTNSPMAAGAGGLSFSSPGAGNTGYINIVSNFASLPWLLFNWNQNGSNNTSPKAVVTFGEYQGNPAIIFLKEVY